MARPELKQFGELEPEDFERHPVWIGCHNADYGKAWYESTDEETFRPWTGNLPADLSEGMLLVKASFELRDGSRYAGFITPSDEPNELGTQQPQLFVGDQRFSFWGGMFGISGSSQQAFYAALNCDPKEIFPLRFVGDPKLATGVMSGQIDGFYIKGKSGIAVEIPERQSLVTPAGAKRYRVEGRNGRGFPQPEEGFGRQHGWSGPSQPSPGSAVFSDPEAPATVLGLPSPTLPAPARLRTRGRAGSALSPNSARGDRPVSARTVAIIPPWSCR